MDKNQRNSQWAILAATRFALALCVVITHSGIVAPDYFFVRHFGATGYPAVFGFFAISGYSIAASLESNPKGYFKRRVRRIYPTYLCALLFAVLILVPQPLHLPLGQVLVLGDWKVIISNAFMLQGILTESFIGDGAVWSLSIEWWCYMLAILLIRISVKWTALLIAISFGALMVYMQSHGYVVGNADMPIHGIPMLVLSWGWLTGFLFYRNRSAGAFMAMLLLPLAMFEMGDKLKFASVVIAASCIAIYFAKDYFIESRALKRTMQWLGDMSYPLYLFHPPLLYVLTAHGIVRNGNALIVAIVALVSIGYFVACKFMAGIGVVLARGRPASPSA